MCVVKADTDQLCSYCKADLCLCFCIGKFSHDTAHDSYEI